MMDVVATFGELVITEGGSAAGIMSLQATAHQREAVSTVFAGYSAQAVPPLPMTLMIVGACMASVNGVIMDATTPEDEEAKKTPQEILAEQQPIE